MATDDDDLAIVRSTISLGHDLGLSIVAEGIEDAQHVDLLDAWAATSPRAITAAARCRAGGVRRQLRQHPS